MLSKVAMYPVDIHRPDQIERRTAFGAARRTAHSWHAVVTCLCALFVCLALPGCTSLQAYRTVVPERGKVSDCFAGSAPAAPGAPECIAQATEHNSQYTLHTIEFDDEGWPFDDATSGRSQIDSAVSQIKAQLKGTNNCVRLFVYVHGWRHNAKSSDSNVTKFREFLAKVGERSKASAASGDDACEDPALAGVSASLKPQSTQSAGRQQTPAEIQTVGIYVGWRGLSVVNIQPLVYASFWDRKNTADRVSQGSVRELFGRLNALASYAPATDKPPAAPSKTSARLRTYVIGHSFGASVVFRALSQSLIDSFSEDLDVDANGELASVSRFVDMVVLVNPAIEAARFNPVFSAAAKLKTYCDSQSGAAGLCDRPKYQAPVLAIFTSEGDVATKRAFPIGASLSNTFESTTSVAQRQSIVQTIGWDDNYRTHTLTLSPSCEAANADPFDPKSNPLRYKAPGWTWCFATSSGSMSLTQLGQPAQQPGQRLVYNGPLWNVRVSSEIVKDHNDTWNDKFRDLLLHLFTDERRNFAVP